MEKEQYRSVIRFLFLDGKKCEEIKARLDAVYGDTSPSMTTVRYWFNEFIAETEAYFEEFDKSYFLMMEKWMEKYVGMSLD